MRKIILLQTVIILFLIWLIAVFGRDEFQADLNESEESINIPQSRVEGNSIWISKESQNSVGILVQKPIQTNYQSKETFNGIVTDINELIESNKNFTSFTSRKIELEIIQSQKKQDLKRMTGLFNAGRKVSKRQLELTELAFEESKRKLIEINSEIEAIVQKTNTNWTREISQGLGKRNSLLFKILSREIDIVKISVLSYSNLEQYSWYISSSGLNKNNNLQAELLGPSGKSLKGETGETWLLKSKLLNLASSSSVVVSAISKKEINGVLIPADALVRYAGESWIYIQHDLQHFERSLLDTLYANERGIFTTKIKPNQLIVTTGAQTLLSEELRHQIKNENED